MTTVRFLRFFAQRTHNSSTVEGIQGSRRHTGALLPMDIFWNDAGDNDAWLERFHEEMGPLMDLSRTVRGNIR